MNTPQELWRRAARGTTAGAVILDSQGRVLLVKHNYGPLNWEIPGGAAELDETPTETVLREASPVDSPHRGRRIDGHFRERRVSVQPHHYRLVM